MGKFNQVLFFNRKATKNGKRDGFKCIGRSEVCDNRTALNIYANTPNPASQFIEGQTEKELNENVEKSINNMASQAWCDMNVEPYL